MSKLLSFFYFFYFAIVGVYIIFIPKVLSQVPYSPSEIGIILGAAPLVRFLLPFLFMRGFALNTKTFRFALLLMSLSAIAFYISLENFYALLLSNIALGAGMSVILPYVEVISLEHLGKERYGKIRLYGSVGFVLVALVLVRILSSASIALDFLLSLTFITALFAFVIEAKSSTQQKQKPQESSNSPINLIKDYRLWLGLIFMQISFGAFYNFFTIYVTDNGISLDMTIYLWSFGVLLEIVMLYFQGSFLKRNLLSILQFTTLATVVRWLILFAFPENITLLFFSQSLHALSFALFHSAAISYLFHLYSNRPLAQQYFSGFTYGLGGLSGALISGYIYEWFASYLFLSAAVFALISFLFIRGFSKQLT
ncbi:MAG: MFS transporter [Campylobacterales bacterium]|nr:MFS transporter [Campylobacterales bacterium]